jgi:hypothetical protein
VGQTEVLVFQESVHVGLVVEYAPMCKDSTVTAHQGDGGTRLERARRVHGGFHDFLRGVILHHPEHNLIHKTHRNVDNSRKEWTYSKTCRCIRIYVDIKMNMLTRTNLVVLVDRTWGRLGLLQHIAVYVDKYGNVDRIYVMSTYIK